MRVTLAYTLVRADQSFRIYIAISEYTELILAISLFTASCCFCLLLVFSFRPLGATTDMEKGNAFRNFTHLHFNEVL